jgi:hypothetical protein
MNGQSFWRTLGGIPRLQSVSKVGLPFPSEDLLSTLNSEVSKRSGEISSEGFDIID